MKMKWKQVFGMGLTAVFLATGIISAPVSGLAADAQPAARTKKTPGIAGEPMTKEQGDDAASSYHG